MRVSIFGATGMVGYGALLECLDHPDVSAVISVGRRAVDLAHPKLRQLAHADFLDFTPLASELVDLDACLWCLGVSAAGMNEADYRRITLDYTLAAAELLAKQNPSMTFCFVSGAGTNANSRQMWARVKAEAEAHVLDQPFAAGYCFRPAFIQPMRGARSSVGLYRAVYAVLGPLYPLLRHLPSTVTSTPEVGRAMLEAALHGAPKPILENADICELARAAAAPPGGDGAAESRR